MGRLKRTDLGGPVYHDLNANDAYDGEPTGTLLAEYDYTVGDDGKRGSVVETRAAGVTTINWQYDAAGRLIQEDYDSFDNNLDYVTDYEFDLVGNRLVKSTDTADGRQKSPITMSTPITGGHGVILENSM